MRQSRWWTLVTVSLVVTAAGCKEGLPRGITSQSATTEIFVDRSDSTRTLRLESQPSLKTALIGGLRNVDVTGVFTLSASRETSSGTYVYSLNGKGERSYTFRRGDGTRWTGTRSGRGALAIDPEGSRWEMQSIVVGTVEELKRSGPTWQLAW
jgi:hypothetical protein